MVYLRYIFLGLLIHAPLYVAGVVFFPLYYLFRKPIYKYKIPIWWWFLNSDEGDYISNVYGDKKWRDRIGFDYQKSGWIKKTWIAFRWLAIRNSHYNFRLAVTRPKQGEYKRIKVYFVDTEPQTSGMTFCNKEIKGRQFATYYVEGRKYFRYSFTKRTPKWLFFLRPFWNVQLGWSSVRVIFKMRFFK